MTKNSEIISIGLNNTYDNFELNDAVALIHHEVIRTQDKAFRSNPPIDKIGIIVGVLHLNDEVELIIKLGKDMAQVTKSEFDEHFLEVEPSEK